MKSQEEIKKELENLRMAEQDAAAKREALEKELAQLMGKESILPKEDEIKEKNEVSFTLSPALAKVALEKTNPKDLKKLLEDYDQRPDAKSREDDPYLLHFSSREAAIDFFREQAEKGRSFLMQEKGKDYFCYSDGKGGFFSGTEAELNQYLKKDSGLTEMENKEAIDDQDDQPTMKP